MNSNRSLHNLLRVIFSEVLMENFDISGWHDDSDKIVVWIEDKNMCNVFIIRWLILCYMVFTGRCP